MKNDHDIKALNDLIHATLDSADGYAEAAKHARSDQLVLLFQSIATERRAAAATLQQCVRSLGGKPDDDGTVLAAAHRMIVGLRTSITLADNKAVVHEVERDEDHIRSKFEHARKDGMISPHTQIIIADVYASVRNSHDQMRKIKQTLHAA